MFSRFTSTATVFVATALWIGCAPPAASHSLSEIKGKVSVGGIPADRVSMKFTPVDPTKGREDVCLLEMGNFTTKLIAGKYKVWFEPLSGGTAIPKKYRTADSSDLELDATGDKSDLNYDMAK